MDIEFCQMLLVYVDVISIYAQLLNDFWRLEGNGNPLQYSSLENPMDGGAW